jgi:hypothetical protein
MIKSIPFTYLLKHISTNKYYYGVRFKKGCHPNDLWTKYFTSSKKVKGLIKRYGKKSFIFEIRKTFKTPQKALNWEYKVLKRLKVIHRNDFLNLTDNKSVDPKYLSKINKGKNNPWYNKKHTKESIEKIRFASLNRRHTKESIEKIRLFNLGRKHTKESKEKIRLGGIGNTNRVGKRHTKESIEKMRLASTGKNNAMYGKKGKYNHRYGKKFSKESIERLRLSKIAYWKKVKKNKIDLNVKSL